MMFSKLSIFVCATLAAFAAAAVPGAIPQAQPENHIDNSVKANSDNKANSCSTGPVKCCMVKRPATASDADLVQQKLGTAIPVGSDVWVTCTDLSALISQGKTCNTQTVCCKKSAADGSIAIECTNV